MSRDVLFRGEIIERLRALKYAGGSLPHDMPEPWKELPLDVVKAIYESGYNKALCAAAISVGGEDRG